MKSLLVIMLISLGITLLEWGISFEAVKEEVKQPYKSMIVNQPVSTSRNSPAVLRTNNWNRFLAVNDRTPFQINQHLKQMDRSDGRVYRR